MKLKASEMGGTSKDMCHLWYLYSTREHEGKAAGSRKKAPDQTQNECHKPSATANNLQEGAPYLAW